VHLPDSAEEAVAAARALLVEGAQGQAGRTVVVERRLEGEEVSLLAFCDGRTVVGMPPAQVCRCAVRRRLIYVLRYSPAHPFECTIPPYQFLVCNLPLFYLDPCRTTSAPLTGTRAATREAWAPTPPLP
jgi:hypothetical protein